MNLSNDSQEGSSFFKTPEQISSRDVINSDENYKFLLTNARSLSPKIESLQNYFESLDLDFALVTESWLKDGTVLNQDVIDLEYGTGLKIIYKNRPARKVASRQVGGGVSVIFDKNKCSFRERRIVGNKYELVAAVGRVGKIPRQVAVFCVYLEPKLRVAEVKEINDILSDQILQLKAKGNPLIIIGGDLNRKSLASAISDFPDIKQANFEPTRSDACLDIIFTNATHTTPTTWPPLQTLQGVASDHSCVVISGSEPKMRDFVWIRKMVRKHSKKSVGIFGSRLDQANWGQILPDGMHPDDMVDKFQGLMSAWIDDLFPLKSSRRRSNEDPWITENIRRLARQKHRVFRREAKSPLWITLRDRLLEKINTSKGEYVDRVEGGGTSTRAYFTAVNSLGPGKVKEEWSVMDLYPGKTTREAGDDAVEFYTKITDEFEPLEQLPPGRITALRPPVTLSEVEKKLKSAKKPNSAVEGDVLPKLMKEMHQKFAVPAMRIYNAVFASNHWPTKWKKETAVVIPKVSRPESLSECRNISCTAFLSKVLESFLLDDLRREIPPDSVQYGGMKGCGVDHLLIDLYDKILGGIDVGSSSIVLGIDYEKAFNRLDHRECLTQLRALGASEASIELTRSFLTQRTVRVRIGAELSAERILKGGSPQGSILGCFLYCITTQQIGSNLAQRLPAPPRGSGDVDAPPPAPPDSPAVPSPATPGGINGMGILATAAPDATDCSPVSEVSGASPVPQLSPDAGPQPRGVNSITTVKYVDDTTVIETSSSPGVRHVTGSSPTEVLAAPLINDLFPRIIDKAEDIGMRVNCKKTQLMCITPDNGYKSTANVAINNETIPNCETMKLLGFTISGDCSMSGQVAMIKDKFRRRLWTLIHLRRAGIQGMRLYRIYAALVRPILETNCVVFHPMLTKGQAEELERLQKTTLKLCFGFQAHYRDILESYGIDSLAARREMAIRKFTGKVMNSERFSNRWLRRRPGVDTEIRRRRPFVENKARTEKYLRSPLVTIQRTANDIATAG